MIKKILILLIVLLYSNFGNAQYATPGNMANWNMDSLVEYSGGAVTFVSGTYFVNQDLTVSSTDTLHLNNDITVKLASNVLVIFEGVLLATPVNQVIFTAIDTIANFKGLKFDNSEFSVLKNCVVEFGGGIKLVDSDMTFENCTIRKNNYANCFGAIDLFYSNPIINNCHIYENKSSAISSGANGSSSPVISNCNIHNNSTDNMNRPQLNLGTSNSTDTIKIINNNISNSYSMVGGISVATLAGGSINCIIDNNIVENNRYGISVFGNNITSIICNNRILNNNLETNPMNGGSGISFYGSSTNVSTVTNNEISGNLWGITIISSAMPNLGEVSDDTTNVGLNTIYNNGNSGVIYDLYNNTANMIKAENNFWGTFDIDSIEMHIFHQPDDASLGFVDYQPIAEEISLSNEKKITYFSFDITDSLIIGTINERNKTIDLQVPYGANVSDLIATFENSEFSSVYVNNVEQISGVTHNDFSDTLIYTVIAQDNSSVNYEVIVTINPSYVKNILVNHSIKIFPNPATNNINIKNTKPHFYKSIEIYDVMQRYVLSNQNIDKGNGIITVDISKLHTGLYFVKLANKHEIVIGNFVVK